MNQEKGKDRIKLPLFKRYSKGEEIFNSVTHGVGAALAIAALTLMVVLSAQRGDGYKVASSIVYGIAMLILYTMSTLYHAIPFPRVKRVLQIFDHCSIFLLIAGTYTPFSIVALRPWPGWLIFGVIWASAILGIVLNAVDLKRFKRFSLVLYIAMGLAIILAFRPLMQVMQPAGIVLLLSGGACYLIGVIFYLLKKVKFMHSIWHLFVLGGSICHYLSILLYIICV